MNQASKALLLSASIVLIGAVIWSFSSTEKDQTEVPHPAHPRQQQYATTQSKAPGAQAAAASAPRPQANKALRVRHLSGRAFAVEDFGPVPSGTIDKVIDDLSRQALDGDATASYGIFLKFNECSNVNRRASRGSTLKVSAEVATACLALSPEDEANSSKWLSLAAEQGNIGARLLYAADSESALGGTAALLRDPDRTKEYKQRAVGYLEEMASQGSADALLQLGNAYHAGVLVDADLVASRAYFEAVRLTDPSIVPDMQISALDKAMSAEQLTLALRKGSQLHETCCR